MAWGKIDELVRPTVVDLRWLKRLIETPMTSNAREAALAFLDELIAARQKVD